MYNARATEPAFRAAKRMQCRPATDMRPLLVCLLSIDFKRMICPTEGKTPGVQFLG